MGPDRIHLRTLKSYLMSLQCLSRWFLSGLGALEKSQLTESWQMSQFSRSARKSTLETTGLLVSLQCPVEWQKKWFWEVLKNTWGIMQSLVTFCKVMRRKSCLSNQISFYHRVTHLAGLGKPVKEIFLEFSKAFDTVYLSVLLDKISNTQLDKHTMWWVSN